VSHVFLSYARRDQEFADRLVAALEGHGVNVWVDRQDIPGGAAWEAAIGEALSVSSAVLVVLSPASVTSEYVPKELSLAEKYDRPIVPILYESWEGSADAAAVKRVEFQLAGLQYVDFARQPFDQGMTALLRCLPAARPVAGSGTPATAIAPRRAARRGLLLAGAGVVALAVLASLLVSRWRGGAAPRIDGDWEGPVAYGWGVTATERFRLRVDGGTVAGTASFLGVPRGILDGRLEGDRIVFRTPIEGGAGAPAFNNGYRGRFQGGEIRFVLQDDRGSPPVEFTARRSGSTSGAETTTAR
jgi:hypothetical protein